MSWINVNFPRKYEKPPCPRRCKLGGLPRDQVLVKRRQAALYETCSPLPVLSTFVCWSSRR